MARAGGRRTLRIPHGDDIVRELDRTEAAGARLLFVGDPDYPAILTGTEGAPPALTILGDPAALNRRAVGLVGARNASTNGRHMAELLAYDLATAGLVVVSGWHAGSTPRPMSARCGPARPSPPSPAASTSPTRPRMPNCSGASPRAAASSPKPRSAPPRRPATFRAATA